MLRLLVVGFIVVHLSSVVYGTWVLGADDSAIMNLYSTTQSGEGTYYGTYSSGGSCSLDPSPTWATLSTTVAMNFDQYFSSAACGMCLQVTGSGVGSGADPITGTFMVYVNNKCPECVAGDLDLGEPGSGRWDISWIAVPCPVVGNLQYKAASGSSQYWIKLQVRNHLIPVR